MKKRFRKLYDFFSLMNFILLEIHYCDGDWWISFGDFLWSDGTSGCLLFIGNIEKCWKFDFLCIVPLYHYFLDRRDS